MVARTLARHDALFPLDFMKELPPSIRLLRRLAAITASPAGGNDKRPGERLADALQDLGPAYIKLGQTLATRSDLVGDEIAEDLTTLQDRLPPFPADEARAAIEDALGAPVDELFKSFEDKPVAAASIAQVHMAVDKDGNKVAVKILRPGIEEIFRRDMDGESIRQLLMQHQSQFFTDDFRRMEFTAAIRAHLLWEKRG